MLPAMGALIVNLRLCQARMYYLFKSTICTADTCSWTHDLDSFGLDTALPSFGTRASLDVAHRGVPRPLLLVPHENSDSAIGTIAEEVLALTKVNWNTTQFDQKLPAPIKAAREVGRILKHVGFGMAISPDFRKYT
jgi:hypothetical protein